MIGGSRKTLSLQEFLDPGDGFLIGGYLLCAAFYTGAAD